MPRGDGSRGSRGSLIFQCFWILNVCPRGPQGQRESSDALGHGPVAPVVLVVLRFPNVFEF